MRNNPGWKYVSATRGAKVITFGMPYDGYHRVDPGVAPMASDYRRPGMGYASFGAPAQTKTPLPANITTESSVTPSLGSVLGIASHGLDAIKSLAPMLDSAFSPAYTKAVGDISTDMYSGNISIYAIAYQVDDAEEVAKIYESNGYAVSIYTQSNPIRQQHNRQLYDYLQCDDANVNGIMDGQLLEDFIARIKNGLRLWHTDGNGNLICTSAPFGVRLGVLCVRDNTEV